MQCYLCFSTHLCPKNSSGQVHSMECKWLLGCVKWNVVKLNCKLIDKICESNENWKEQIFLNSWVCCKLDWSEMFLIFFWKSWKSWFLHKNQGCKSWVRPPFYWPIFGSFEANADLPTDHDAGPFQQGSLEGLHWGGGEAVLEGAVLHLQQQIGSVLQLWSECWLAGRCQKEPLNCCLFSGKKQVNSKGNWTYGKANSMVFYAFLMII